MVEPLKVFEVDSMSLIFGSLMDNFIEFIVEEAINATWEEKSTHHSHCNDTFRFTLRSKRYADYSTVMLNQVIVDKELVSKLIIPESPSVIPFQGHVALRIIQRHPNFSVSFDKENDAYIYTCKH